MMSTNKQYPGGTLMVSESDMQLIEESMKAWRKCMGESIIKYGLPWASVATAIQYYIAQRVSNNIKVPQGLNKPKIAFWFLGNFSITMICLLPSCYNDLKKKLTPLKAKLMQNQGMGAAVQSSEGSFQSHDDINFQSNLEPKFDGPSSNFSHLDLDIDIANDENLQGEDIDKQAESLKVPTTTYYDLRKRNRENYYKQLLTSLPQRDQQLDVASESQKQKAKSPFSPTSSSSGKNQYGDDIE